MSGDWDRAMTRQVTAWHEAGHAIAGTALGLSVRYVTLRPYGSGGRTHGPCRADLGRQQRPA